MLAPVRWPLVALLVIGLAQLVLLLVLGGVMLSNVPARVAAKPSVEPDRRAVGATALLFICASLPLYLGAEVRGRSRTVRRGLAFAVAVVGLCFFVAALGMATVPKPLLGTSRCRRRRSRSTTAAAPWRSPSRSGSRSARSR